MPGTSLSGPSLLMAWMSSRLGLHPRPGLPCGSERQV